MEFQCLFLLCWLGCICNSKILCSNHYKPELGKSKVNSAKQTQYYEASKCGKSNNQPGILSEISQNLSRKSNNSLTHSSSCLLEAKPYEKSSSLNERSLHISRNDSLRKPEGRRHSSESSQNALKELSHSSLDPSRKISHKALGNVWHGSQNSSEKPSQGSQDTLGRSFHCSQQSPLGHVSRISKSESHTSHDESERKSLDQMAMTHSLKGLDSSLSMSIDQMAKVHSSKGLDPSPSIGIYQRAMPHSSKGLNPSQSLSIDQMARVHSLKALNSPQSKGIHQRAMTHSLKGYEPSQSVSIDQRTYSLNGSDSSDLRGIHQKAMTRSFKRFGSSQSISIDQMARKHSSKESDQSESRGIHQTAMTHSSKQLDQTNKTGIPRKKMSHLSKGLDPSKISRNRIPRILTTDYLTPLLKLSGKMETEKIYCEDCNRKLRKILLDYEIPKALKDHLYELRPTSFSYPKDEGTKEILIQHLESVLNMMCCQLHSCITGKPSNIFSEIMIEMEKDVVMGISEAAEKEESAKAVVLGYCYTMPKFYIITGPQLDDRDYYFISINRIDHIRVFDYFYTEQGFVKIFPQKIHLKWSIDAYDNKDFSKDSIYPGKETIKLFQSLKEIPKNIEVSEGENRKETDEFCKEIIYRSSQWKKLNRLKRSEFVGELREVFLFDQSQEALLFGKCHCFFDDFYIFVVKKEPTKISCLLGVKRKNKIRIVHHLGVAIGRTKVKF